MSKQIHEVEFDDKGEALRFDITLTSPLPCTYEITAHDSSGVYQGTIMKGNNIGGPTDSFHIPTDIREMDRRVVGWHIIFGAPDKGDQEEFSAELSFFQGQTPLLTAPINISGTHSTEKTLIGFARFLNEGVLQQPNDNVTRLVM